MASDDKKPEALDMDDPVILARMIGMLSKSARREVAMLIGVTLAAEKAGIGISLMSGAVQGATMSAMSNYAADMGRKFGAKKVTSEPKSGIRGYGVPRGKSGGDPEARKALFGTEQFCLTCGRSAAGFAAVYLPVCKDPFHKPQPGCPTCGAFECHPAFSQCADPYHK